jgi:hypothetical protein
MARTSTRNASRADEDLQDSPQDLQKMQGEETNMLLPDVEDIPGQEHIHVPPLGDLADTTASSDDEEGAGLLDDDDEDDDLDMEDADDVDDDNLLSDDDEDDLDEDDLDEDDLDDEDEDDSDVTDEERADLEASANVTPGEEDADALRRATLDDVDDEGERLEEVGFGDDVTGDDLDLPEPDMDDEENDTFSLGSDDNDEMTEGTP